MNNEQVDAMLFAKISAIREQARNNSTNPLWVAHMLQQIIDKNRAADMVLRPTFATLQRPSLREIGEFIELVEREMPAVFAWINRLNWSEDGTDTTIDVTLATMKNLFVGGFNVEETEKLILATAKDLGLLTCPNWVIPALYLYIKRRGPGIPQGTEFSRSVNICLTADDGRNPAFAMRLHEISNLYMRSGDRHSPWSSSMNWLFVKPRSK